MQAVQTRTLREHPAVKAWCEIDPHGRVPASVERLQGKNPETGVYRLVCARADGGAVIAKRSQIELISAECLVYQEVLTHLPVPAPRYYGAVNQSDGEYGWLFVEEAVGDEYDAENEQHRAAAGRWLALFHTAASRLDVCGRLPGRDTGHYLEHLQSARAAIGPHLGRRLLSDEEREALRSVLDRCDRFEARWHEIETFFEGIPRTVVHGDFHLYNVCVQRRSHDVGLVPFDYADAGWGVPAADLAHFPGDGFAYSVQPDLPTYQAMVAGVWPRLDAHDIHLLAEFGTAFRAFSELWWESWRISYPYESDRERVWLTEFIDSARVYLARMDEVAAAAGWER